MSSSANYPPKHHLETDPERLVRLIEILRLATLVSANGDATEVSFIPMLAHRKNGRLMLTGHLDANNPQAARLDGTHMQAIFHGPQGYISPDDYRSSQLPTWNYVHVVASGPVRELPHDEDKRDLLMSMSAVFGGRAQKFDLRMDDARMTALLGGIRAFRMEVEHVAGRFKLSQDKSPVDAAGALLAMKRRTASRDTAVYNWIRDEGALPQ